MLQALPNIQPEKPSLHWLGLTDEELAKLRITLEADIEVYGDDTPVSIYLKVLRLCGVMPDARH